MSDLERKIQLYGTRGSADAYAIRDFLHRCDQPFDWIELTNDQQAHTEAQVTGLGDKRLPICVFPDGVRLEHPTVRQISEKLGLFRSPSQTEYDLAIYGAGPAGLSAALYGASEGLKTVVVERSWNGFGRCICFIGRICVRLRCILCAALRLPGSRRFVPDSLLEEAGFELVVPL